MNLWRRKRLRAQSVSLSGVPFTDSADSHADLFSIRGAALLSATSQVPPDGVRRLLDLDEPDKSLLHQNWPGYGRGLSAHASLGVRRRGVGVRVSAAVRPFPPLKAKQRSADWRAFAQLRVRVPSKVEFCVRRRVRRSVLFAVGVGGRARSAPGRGGHYHRTQNSQWRC